MSKKSFKSQASSSRVIPTAFGGPNTAFGSAVAGFGTTTASQLSYVYEPPDLTGLSDPAVVVALKGLQKKDSITKAKALEDLQTYVSNLQDEKGTLEDAFLEAWIKLYGRTSIDNSRQVRQRAHSLQGQITSVCGKRIAKDLRTLAGPWLAGLEDADKSVSKAAQDALVANFSTSEKRLGVWKVYQDSIIEYCNVVLQEDARTLSDERTVTSDDAESKYTRTIGCAILTIAKALDILPIEELEKHQTSYELLLRSEKLWELASHKDAFVRRSIYKLLPLVLAKNDQLLNLDMLSTNLLFKALHVDQTGAAVEYVAVLSFLTSKYPEVWTKHYKGSGKKSAQRRLAHFLRNIPEIVPSAFWTSLKVLLASVPEDALCIEPEANDQKESQDLHRPVLEALQYGASRNNSRSGEIQAWYAYFSLTGRLVPSSRPDADREAYAKSWLLPLAEQHFNPQEGRASWNIRSAHKIDCLMLCADSMALAASISVDGASTSIHTISERLVEGMQASLPEQAKDFIRSQNHVIDSFAHWYTFQEVALSKNSRLSLKEVFDATTRHEVGAAIELLKTRNGKPFGAAAVLGLATELTSRQRKSDGSLAAELEAFANEDVPALMGGPSTAYLLQFLQSFESLTGRRAIYATCVQSLVEKPESAPKSEALSGLLTTKWPEDAQLSKLLQRMVLGNMKEVSDGHDTAMSQVNVVLTNATTPSQLIDNLLISTTTLLGSSMQAPTAVESLRLATDRNPAAIRRFLSSPNGPALLSKLLYLSQSAGDDSLKQSASVLSVNVNSLLSNGDQSAEANDRMIIIIHEGVHDTSDTALSIDSLVSLSMKVAGRSDDVFDPEMLARLSPTSGEIQDSLYDFLEQVPDPSLAVTNVLGGAIYLVDQGLRANVCGVSYDLDGRSPTVRMVQYVLTFWKTLTNDTRWKKSNCKDWLVQASRMNQMLAVFCQLATDHLSVPPAQPLWDYSTEDTDSELLDLISEAQTYLQSNIANDYSTHETSSQATLNLLLESSKANDAASFYNARAYAALCSEMIESQGTLPDGLMPKIPADFKTSSEFLLACAILASTRSPADTLQICNELISTLTVLDFDAEYRQALKYIVMLNIILQSADSLLAKIPQQRLVFFVRHIVPAIKIDASSQALDAELFKVLLAVAPLIGAIYDSLWEQLVDVLLKSFASSSSGTPVLSSALRLYSKLRFIVEDEETNDDLKEYWSSKSANSAGDLIMLLEAQADLPDINHQPRRIVNDLLARQVGLLPAAKVDAVSLYPVIACESQTLQRAAFKILHREIPKQQEEISLDAALTKDFTAKLPEELLSLILETPANIGDLRGRPSMPASLSGYLLSWKLILDHWTKASYKVQNDYLAHIKEENHVKALLDLTFGVLIRNRSKPVDPSLISVATFDTEVEEVPEKDAHRWLSHLYYLALCHLPGLVRNWWRDDCPRSLQKPVEDWTERFISPFVAKAELETVSEWLPTQDSDQTIEVKVSVRSREVTASYPIDDQVTSVRISLPPTYPLAPIAVEGLHRVGVDEKKWRTWLINVQGVMNFASSSGGLGAVIDGLVTWRKNVIGALKGQSECAICYSVVNADRQLPSKNCGTCKNAFHGSCLFRWFKSSGNSSCPLCRNAFAYG